jgi:hypothetical protein
LKKTQEIPLMKKIMTIAVATMAMMAAAPAFAAGNTDSAQATSTATVIAPITIQKTAGTDLKFGTLVAGYTSAVAVSPAGGRSGGGATYVMAPGAGALAVGAASFDVTGDTNRAFTTGAAVDSGNQLTGLTIDLTGAPTALTAGAATILAGGSLPPGLAAGSYTGTFTVTVTYN